MASKEVATMIKVEKMFNELNEDELRRVVGWVKEKWAPETRAVVNTGGVTFSSEPVGSIGHPAPVKR